jgi:serine phosphatase RsbU (regulator of sigma subunit)
MRGSSKTATLIFGGLTALMAVVIIGSFIGAVSWVNKPFAGLLLYDFPQVGTYSLKDWPGRQAGIKSLERIVYVDGKPIKEGRNLVKQIEKKSLGALVSYTISSKGSLQNYSLPVITFSLREFVLVFFLTFLGGIAIFCLGFVVYILKPNVANSWVFFLFCFFLGLYMVSAFDIQSTYYFVNLHYFALCVMPAVLFHLGLVFPEKKHIVQRVPALEYLIYLPALTIAIGYQIYLLNFDKVIDGSTIWWIPSYPKMLAINRYLMLFCVIGMISMVFHSMIKASSTLDRLRGRMVLFGLTLAFAPPVTIMLLVSLFKVNFPWNFLVFFVVLFPAAIAYSIVKHNLFDADAIIKRTVGYIIVTGIVIGAYLIVSLTINVTFGQYQISQSKAFPIVFTLVVILLFNPLRDRVQSLVDRIFFRKEYDYGKIIDKIGGAITSLMDLGQILKRLSQTFADDMFIDTSSIMLLSADGTAFKVYLADGENHKEVEEIVIQRDDPIVEIIESEKKVITKYDMLEDPKYKKVSTQCLKRFEALYTSLMVPLIFQDKVIGLLNLGDKKSGKFYNREDIDLLHALSNQGAVAIENARLFQDNLEKQRMEEELAIGRELQMSMLPAECPRIEGFEMTAFSKSAREVGGDFYDFIEISDNKLGIVVGDVTGKSVSGALVMSASRSIFRMLGENNLAVSESMISANRRTKKDIKSGMFVALLYALLDAKNRTIDLCSAGQTQPIMVSAATRKAVLVETRGDTFPLGILDDVNYEETKISMSLGDQIVFYTDGIVEAMNEENEMFGFERLLAIIEESSALSAEALLDKIISQVREYCGSAEQHDDLTVIVLKAAETIG